MNEQRLRLNPKEESQGRARLSFSFFSVLPAPLAVHTYTRRPSKRGREARARGQRRKTTKSEVFCAASPSWGPPYIALAAAGAGLRAAALAGGFPQNSRPGLVASAVVQAASTTAPLPFPLSLPLSLSLSAPLVWLCFSLVFGWGVGLRPPRRGGGRTDGRLRARRAIWKTGGRVARPPSRRLPCLACLFCPRLALTVTGWVDWGASGRVWCLNGRRLPPSIFSGTAICSFPLSLSLEMRLAGLVSGALWPSRASFLG